jgi:polysaccharide pyruvyl transferase WcaK-like protein
VRRVALLGLLGSGNIGNDGSLETVLARWRRPGVELSCVTVAPAAVEARYGLPSSALSSYRPAPGAGPARRTLGKVLGRLRDARRTYALAGAVDVVVVPGAGVLEESLATRPWGMPLWLFMTALACRLRGSAFVLLDVGAEAARRRATRWLLVRTVGLARHVSYRDRWSQEQMRACGAREPDAVAADLTFAHPAHREASPEPGLVVVGTMAYYGPADDPVAGAAVRSRYVEVVVDVVGRLVDAGDRVALVVGDLVDLEVAHEIRSTVTSVRPDRAARVQVREAVTFSALVDEMARAEVVVASRFHNLVCALRLGRPTVSVGYAVKSRRLMAEVGLGDLCQDLLDIDADTLAEHVARARAEGAAATARIEEVTRGYARLAEALLDDVDALFVSPAPGSPAAPDGRAAPSPHRRPGPGGTPDLPRAPRPPSA